MASGNFIVVYDACVLYPAPLRDFLMHLAAWSQVFQAKWSEDIHAEWLNALLRKRPDLDATKLQRTRNLMDIAVPDALIEQTRYRSLIQSLSLPDPKDRHVLAAAIACRAQLIVTFNLKDFPSAMLESYQIDAIHPDKFVSGLIDLNERVVLRCLQRQALALRNPPSSTPQILAKLEQLLPLATARMRPLASRGPAFTDF